MSSKKKSAVISFEMTAEEKKIAKSVILGDKASTKKYRMRYRDNMGRLAGYMEVPDYTQMGGVDDLGEASQWISKNGSEKKIYEVTLNGKVVAKWAFNVKQGWHYAEIKV